MKTSCCFASIASSVLFLSCLPTIVNGKRRYLRSTGQTSTLWGTNGELWNATGSSSNNLLYDFTHMGYKLANAPIPDYPVGVIVTDSAFGAIPNDDISDVSALRLAIAACPPNAAVYIPNGRYIIDEPLDVLPNSIVIRGQSRDGVVLYFPKHMGEVLGTATSDVPFITFRGGSNRGIENLSLEFRNEQKATGYFLDPDLTSQTAEHWFYSGEALLSMSDGEQNSWIRNIYIKNSNHAIAIVGMGTRQISVIDVIIDQFYNRKGLAEGKDGHMGIKVGNAAQRILVHNVLFTGIWDHELAIMGAKYSVFSRIQGANLEIDHHAMGNEFNLFTEIDTGIGGRGYGGNTNNIRETYWGIKGIRQASYLPTTQGATMVGIHTSEPTSIGATWHHETLDPNHLVPANMFLAQMALKPAKHVPTDATLTLPPPSANNVLQVLPIDDACIESGQPTTNFGFNTFCRLTNSREVLMKFDLTSLGLTQSIAKATLKFYIGELKVGPFGVEVRELADNTWSDATLTYATAPVAGAVIAWDEVDPTAQYGWIELDVTPYVNTKITMSEALMSVRLNGGGTPNYNKNAFTRVQTIEGGSGPHIVIHKTSSTIFAPSQPWGLSTSAGTSLITLNWQENTETDLASYNVYRHDGLGNYILEAMGLTGSAYTDYVVKPGLVYTYVVTAVDTAGTESPPSSSVTATLLSGDSTAAPTQLRTLPPTVSLTVFPTVPPTVSPTVSPTEPPTNLPTLSPSFPQPPQCDCSAANGGKPRDCRALCDGNTCTSLGGKDKLCVGGGPGPVLTPPAPTPSPPHDCLTINCSSFSRQNQCGANAACCSWSRKNWWKGTCAAN